MKELCKKDGILTKNVFLGMMIKKSEFDLGSALFGISEVGFLPYGVQMKGVLAKRIEF